MNANDTVQVDSQTFAVRKSFFAFLSQLIALGISILILYIAVIFFLNKINNYITMSIAPFITIFTISLLVLAIFIALVSLARWRNRYYVIRPRQFIVHDGLIQRKEKIFELDQVESISVTQSIVGRMLDYGTLSIFSPVFPQKIRIEDIPDPVKYQKILLTPEPRENMDRNIIMPRDVKASLSQGE